jgi:hypothetical protein
MSGKQRRQGHSAPRFHFAFGSFGEQVANAVAMQCLASRINACDGTVDVAMISLPRTLRCDDDATLAISAGKRKRPRSSTDRGPIRLALLDLAGCRYR